MKLFLDDIREPGGEWTWVKTASEAIRVLAENKVEMVSLDHDLGQESDVGDGYMVLTWIEHRAVMDDAYVPPIINIHTANVAARLRMKAAVKSIDEIVKARA